MYKLWLERNLPAAYAPLLANAAVIIGCAADTPEDPFVALGEAEAIIAGARLRYNTGAMAHAPRLRVITRTGIGLDNVNLEDATAHGIAVCYTPDAPTISTAEHTIALMFAVAKQLKQHNLALEKGEKKDFFSSYSGLELYQAKLGIIGLGRIGGRVAYLGQALGMNVIGYDPFVGPERAAELGIGLVTTIEAVLEVADVVTVHVPLLPETHNLMNAARLARMKPGAILINAARGGLVDESALFDALSSGHLAGAGLDVFTVEPPPPDHPLLALENVLATPHIAGATLAGKDRLWQMAISQTLQVLRGEQPAHLVNPEVWPRLTT